ncbi:pseudouridylate synthase, partial [Acinetobacter baumannii]
PFYPVVQHKSEDDFSEPLQLLAKHISFTDPVTKEGMSFNSKFELTL